MSILTRREARERLLELLFETEFRGDENPIAIYAISAENREIPSDDYIKNGYSEIFEHREEIDRMIGAHSNGWKPERLTRLSRSILRLAVYEMMYQDDIPYSVSINEAVELAKKYDDDKARPFINGVLNSVKNQLLDTRGEKPERGEA